MDTELEYKFLNVNIEEIIQKLENLNAKFIFDTVYKIYNHDKDEWRSYQGRIRLREGNGKATMAYKAQQEDGFDLELEFGIDDIEKAHKLVEHIGIPLKRFEEKRRIRYELNGVEVDIDFWPDIEPYIEIEASTHKAIEETAKLLGLDVKNGVKLNAALIYQELSGKKMDKVVKFKKNDWRLSKFTRE